MYKKITVSDEMKGLPGILRARHENVNERLIIFNIIGQSFRHSVSMHGTVFLAVLQFTEIMINTFYAMDPIH